MKKVISLLVLAMLQSVSLMAQRLTIEQFSPANEFTASQYPRQDANGKDCALLKVQVVDAITGVEGGVVGAIGDHGSEKWVYIEDGQREFKLIFANHLPIQISTRNYPAIGVAGVKGGSTYVLTLADTSGGSAVVDAGKQYLVMSVQPKNATVFIDGKLEKVDADGTVMTYLPYGNYSYRVMAVGYKEQSGTVTVGREKATLNVELSSTMATLNVTCATPNADIYVNGNREGNGSWSGHLAAGTYNLEAKRTGYRSNSTSLTLAENESRNVTIPALSPIYGAINVGYTPANAEVWLDGKQLGTTPDIFRNVGVGSHSLQIKKDGYEPKTLNITVTEGQTADVQGSLSRKNSGSPASPSTSVSASNNATSGQKNEENAEELYQKGLEYYDAKDYTLAVEYYRKAAEQGNADAQCNLGVCYHKGIGVPQDLLQAVSWYRKAAEQGNADAQFNLGFCYQYGVVVTQDFLQAVSWYRKAVEQGNADAQCFLGWCYQYGLGVTQDYSQAVSLYRKAAEQGDASAQFRLGFCYENGQGVTQSYSQAVYWYRKAVGQGYFVAKDRLKKLQDEGKI